MVSQQLFVVGTIMNFTNCCFWGQFCSRWKFRPGIIVTCNADLMERCAGRLPKRFTSYKDLQHIRRVTS